MKSERIAILLNIAKRGGLQNEINASAAELAAEIGVSQQTANRWLLELQSEGLIERGFGKIAIPKKGREQLWELKSQIADIFKKTDKRISLAGRLVSGMHEGKFYLSIKEYSGQMRDALGYGIFPGTLNLKLNEKGREGKKELMAKPGIGIAGFRKNGRLLGGAKLFRAKIIHKKLEAKGAAIIPYKSHYGAEVLELVSAENLRKKFHLKNNDEVRVLIDI
ncbi:MAG: DUF120 domain-containing protein [Candidatus Micrarchaeota archaeon]